MTIYVALLRGINVGGKNMIKMAALKNMFESMGLSRVKTYIQSGNVLFESEKEEEVLRKQIENKIEVIFGFSVIVVLRKAEELKRIVSNCPFSADEISAAEAASEAESLYVSFLLEAPSQEGVERLSTVKSENDEFRIVGREVFLLFPQSIRNSKLANSLQMLKVPATVRNWKTVNKLVSLISEMEEG
ncbi:DUF1697 domain-containing protein [Paenibacillus eucommiae]|uniref:Uncharacterized protein (DUF1697 family) n=1 Tax=Paenibacillus eucommiae TaxID=1355755 RepID=A0ABS4J9Q7_9BACL|nr:DUF1697 domain-containing protein [Paenibacillus eucommiae]MBP1996525.1 uncharacterized protein (DUF1697 family) [Paenibacillus eucommiae]